MNSVRNTGRLIAAMGVVSLLHGCADAPKVAATRQSTVASEAFTLTGQVVGMRRLTEAQYRNSIADIFGDDIRVAGRFEPIVRPAHHLIASGATGSTISPAGLEQFDATARAIADQVFDDTRRATFAPCRPKNEATPDSLCAQTALARIGRYLFRRPLTTIELAGFVSMADKAAKQTGTFHGGLKLALSAMLMAPQFLYVIETAEPDPDGPGMRLDSYSRASRLSFLLWDTAPNDMLLTAAQSGSLLDQAVIDDAARKMIVSPRFQAGVRAFFSDMLLFEKFDEIAKDPVVYRMFNQNVAKDLPEQMLRTIIDHLVTRRGDYREMFTTRRTFMTRSLGPIYGVPVRAPTGWQPYEFAPSSSRAGLLSQAGFLALYSHSGRSSPTLRGRAVRELLLCQPVPNPPGNVNFTVVQDTTNKVLRTARLRLTAHNTDPVCSACHKITDPIGLPMEAFDGIGSSRSRENGAAIDLSGSFEGTDFLGAEGLGRAMATSASATSCVASRALEYARGRSSEGDAELIEEVGKAFAADQFRISGLFLHVATAPEMYRFRSRESPEPPMIASLRLKNRGLVDEQ